MPVMKCERNGKPGWKWGESGHCYTYTPGDKASNTKAKAKAQAQGQAIQARMSANEKVAEGLRERRKEG